MEVRWVASLGEVPSGAWDRLVGPLGFYSSHAWLRSLEQSDEFSASYLLVESGGDLIACLPVYEGMPGVLRAGARVGNDSQVLAEPGVRQEAVRLLVDALLGRAADAGLATVLVDQVQQDDADQLALCDAEITDGREQAVIHLGDGDYQSYVDGLSKNGRSAVRAETRRFTAAGYSVRTARLSECVDDVVPLFEHTVRKYGTGLSAAQLRAICDQQIAHLDDSSVVFLCVEDTGAVVGCSLCFAWRDGLYARVVGFDYPRLRDADEYFTTNFYAPIRYLREHGLRTLHLGVGALEAKVRRGATLHPRWRATLAVSR